MERKIILNGRTDILNVTCSNIYKHQRPAMLSEKWMKQILNNNK